jgi:hypothetical protein
MYLLIFINGKVSGRYYLILSSSLFLYSLVSQNTEDEVLKAAIAKYGKNQWLVRLNPMILSHVVDVLCLL